MAARAACILLLCLFPATPAFPQELEKSLADCRRMLDACSSRQEECQGSLNNCNWQIDKLNKQLEKLADELEKCNERLRATENELTACERAQLLPQQRRDLEDQIEALRHERALLEKDSKELELKKSSLDETAAGLVRDIEKLRGLRNVFRRPDLIGRANRLFNSLKGEEAPETVSCIIGGRRYLVTNLVLGTLTVSYDQDVLPGTPTQLKLEFEPHSVLSDDILGAFLPDEVVTRWYVRPEYDAQTVSSRYDFTESGRKPQERELNLRTHTDETWVWTVTGKEDFEKDASDLIFYLGYSTGSGARTENDVWRQTVEWKETFVPGVLDNIWTWIRDKVVWGLGLLALVLGILASWKTIQVRNLELTLKRRAPVP